MTMSSLFPNDLRPSPDLHPKERLWYVVNRSHIVDAWLLRTPSVAVGVIWINLPTTKMDCGADSDFFLQDEKFDFDVSLSPASSKGDEDEDEVFVGPVGLKERCGSVTVVPHLEECVAGVQGSWSPLTGDQLEAVCQEAHRLASQLQSMQPQSATDAVTADEEFLQDAQAKMGVLGQTASALSPIKRQTFCVQDSPMRQLPPAIQRHLLRGTSSSAASFTRPTSTARLSTSSPVAGARVQPRTALRGKAPLGIAVVLPSKPVAPAASFSASKSRAEKSRLHPPSKTAGVLKRSPSSRPSKRAESCEDLLSDSASVASDISADSLNSSLLGKRPLAPPTKSVGTRNLSGVKASGLQSRRVTDRKNTSSSSSSMSSFNSSLSLSPAKGKLNSSLNRSLSSSTGPAPSSVSRPTRPRRSTAFTAAEPAPSTASRRSLSVQSKKTCEPERNKAPRPAPLKTVEATPLQPTPPKRLPGRTASVTTTTAGRLQSGLKAKPKPEALVLPTPSTAGRGVRRADDVSKVLKPKRLMSTSSIDSLPQKPSAVHLTPSAGSGKSLQVKARRPSALPTPVRRRPSAVPAPTCQTVTARPPTGTDSDDTPTPSSARKQQKCSGIPQQTGEEEGVDPPEVQPFCLEEEESSVSPPSTTQDPGPAENLDHGEEIKRDSVPAKNLIELDSAEESASKTQEVLLLDLPAPALQPQEKLLIDLTNTPDLIRTSAKSCTSAQQLIDLSSPLIKWSPEDKKENNAPLINLSF
ncbi:G2 and S phase-expressed protein 1 [Xenentodon cancila]